MGAGGAGGGGEGAFGFFVGAGVALGVAAGAAAGAATSSAGAAASALGAAACRTQGQMFEHLCSMSLLNSNGRRRQGKALDLIAIQNVQTGNPESKARMSGQASKLCRVC